MPKTTLLPLLASGEYCSGQTLANALGVSRTAVWKQLNALSDLGLQIESARGRGYRIPGGIDLLDAGRVQAALAPRAADLLDRLALFETIDSTNAEAMRQAELGAGPGLVCSAEQQTAGRGRRGRTWVSPFARNIYLSLVWQYHQGAAALEGLSLAVGVAVARALASCGVPPVQLKWPNDVIFRGAKLGGVLLEMTGDAAGTCQVIVGVGLNVAMPGAAAADIDQAWTDIDTISGGTRPGRNALLAALLNQLLPLLADFEQRGFGPWRDEWLALDAFADRPVVLHTGAVDLSGIARGVDARGALQLETAAAGVQSIFGGEISLRAAP
ncbi:MAG: bifunctional biotin--[acetyl-CoA-carboxylase] ligase/biotin operon repressor BirA [Halieaceae bacterium]|jgi:BirA family biotin operon repressor/biotin-[acetyl-CoA-carboxylase] ligase|nr:bifunctional biotin--[acetyl-CoA-carboxylase] ligase/biotin operon repressor BirA [Halieaceae bacterium]